MEKKSLNRILVIIMGIMVLSALVVTAYAAVPMKINYQGYVTDSVGVPVSGSANMVFKLYSSESSTTALWTEAQTVSVNNGVFSVVLGSVTTLTLPFDAQYWLGVTVGGDPEMLPRQAVNSTAYAITANTALSVSDSALSANVALLDNAQTVTGVKTFNPSSGSVPFSVDATKTGTVTNLNADTVDGSHASSFAAASHTQDVSTVTNAVSTNGSQTISGSKTFSSQIASSVATGTAPLSVASTTKVTNLNADSLDGNDSSAFATASHIQDVSTVTNAVSTNGAQTISGSKTFSSRIISSATGTEPFNIASTTVVTNLNSDLHDGYHAGNSSGNIPLSNGTVNTNLNADLLDGMNSATAATASTIAARDSSGNLTAADFVYSSSKSGAIIASAADCVRGTSGGDPHLSLEVSNPPSNSYGPSMIIGAPAINTTYNLYCPVHIQIPPGSTFTLTGGSFAHTDFDSGLNCLVGAEIRTKTFGTSSNGTTLASVYDGTSSTDYSVNSGSPLTKAFPAISSTITDSTVVWINAIIKYSSATTGDCRYSGSYLTYTVSKP